ncbi:hypothetical protein [Stutzerimonas stutzeri]|uniref:hypothetical protein n=1 Tax=Stutzerimonas stutzeri TaxID=316 RepID=UPI0015E375EE|nr:hypothetical protein [Stutzerimonas stutzeri]MBA1280402.1 hypothetical protein [Stutzerimonas stutzeri]
MESADNSRTIEDDIVEWRWDGSSIEGIKAHAAEFGLTLLDLVDVYFAGGWPDTVPADYLGYIAGKTEVDSCSRPCIKHYLTILACDANGQALVFAGLVDKYSGGEGFDVTEMTIAEAVALADEYRAAFDAAAPTPSRSMRMG